MNGWFALVVWIAIFIPAFVIIAAVHRAWDKRKSIDKTQ